MRNKKNKIAICYDFDGTLAPGNMQEHSLLPALNLTPKDFWKEVKELAKKNNMNEILSYMYLIIEKSKQAKHQIRREAFKNHGKNICLFEGVDEYFDLIKTYASNKNITIEHYIISSGLKEIIEGTKIKRHFKYIYASEFYYDENGVAIWPACAVDYTLKTQFLFRVNKGTFDIWDNSKINKYTPENERYIPFKRMIYIGDGETDIPCMKMVNYQGGYSIAVYDSNKRGTENKKSPKQICQELIDQKRAKLMAPADYTNNSELVRIIKLIIDKIAIETALEQK
jgi:2-hydroxy-3-keto-5-methylthiopentenyl-1-phosphate phosphatase